VSDTPRAKPRGFFLNVVPAVLYVFAIFYTGMIHLPRVDAPTNFDKVMHAGAFGFMQLVVLRAVAFEVARIPARRQNLIAFILVVAAGGLLEVVQSFTSYRSAELLDWIADIIGAGLVAIVVERLRSGARASST
jgi:VanZ family protein